jgi:hypothetical protein
MTLLTATTVIEPSAPGPITVWLSWKKCKGRVAVCILDGLPSTQPPADMRWFQPRCLTSMNQVLTRYHGHNCTRMATRLSIR